jgi:hypothetical protein
MKAEEAYKKLKKKEKNSFFLSEILYIKLSHTCVTQ